MVAAFRICVWNKQSMMLIPHEKSFHFIIYRKNTMLMDTSYTNLLSVVHRIRTLNLSHARPKFFFWISFAHSLSLFLSRIKWVLFLKIKKHAEKGISQCHNLDDDISFLPVGLKHIFHGNFNFIPCVINVSQRWNWWWCRLSTHWTRFSFIKSKFYPQQQQKQHRMNFLDRLINKTVDSTVKIINLINL